jgi:hypothetical protein
VENREKKYQTLPFLSFFLVSTAPQINTFQQQQQQQHQTAVTSLATQQVKTKSFFNVIT